MIRRRLVIPVHQMKERDAKRYVTKCGVSEKIDKSGRIPATVTVWFSRTTCNKCLTYRSVEG